MLITGFALRSAIARHRTRRDSATAQFPHSFTRFAEEEGHKPTPQETAESIAKAELAIAVLQVYQERYNLCVRVKVQGVSMTLAEAIKRHGGVERLEKLWKTKTTPKEDRYGVGHETQRSKDIVVARTVMTPEEILKEAEIVARAKSDLGQAIAEANAKEVSLDDLDATLMD